MEQDDDLGEYLAALGDGPTHADRLREIVGWDSEKLSSIPVDHPAWVLRGHGGWTLTLASGRETYLRHYHQYATYGGVLCGIPTFTEHFVLESIRAAEKLFPHAGAKPMVLEPVLRALPKEYSRHGDDHGPPILPQVCSIAELVSSKSARNPDDSNSSLIAIWYQDRFGLPEDPDILEKLRAIDWDMRAHDWTP